MKWVLAGISFAFLVALALATAAVKSDNVRTRARIEQISMDVDLCRLEVERRSLEVRGTPEHLARLWREARERMLGDWR